MIVAGRTAASRLLCNHHIDVRARLMTFLTFLTNTSPNRGASAGQNEWRHHRARQSSKLGDCACLPPEDGLQCVKRKRITYLKIDLILLQTARLSGLAMFD